MKRKLVLLSVSGLLWANLASAVMMHWSVPTSWGADSTTAVLVHVNANTEINSNDLVAFAKQQASNQAAQTDGDSTTYTAVAWNGTYAINNGDFVGSLKDAVQTGDYYLVLFDNDGAWAHNSKGANYTSAETALLTALAEGSAENVSPFFEGFNAGNPLDGNGIPLYDPGDWTTSSVPEPTVLALLALGLSGLTLRRRVA